MPGQRIIDPADPQSIMRMLDRIDKLEKSNSQLKSQMKRTRATVKEIAVRKGKGCSNLQFTSTSNTIVTYTTGFVIDEAGINHLVTGSTVTTSGGVAGGTNFYFIYNPEHAQMYATTSDSTLSSILANPGCLHVTTMAFPSLGQTFPGTAGAVYPLGTQFG